MVAGSISAWELKLSRERTTYAFDLFDIGACKHDVTTLIKDHLGSVPHQDKQGHSTRWRLELLTQLYQVAQQAMIENTPALPQHGGDHKSEEYQGYHDNLDQRGNSSHYRIALLKRDHPTIAADLAAGKYSRARGRHG